MPYIKYIIHDIAYSLGADIFFFEDFSDLLEIKYFCFDFHGIKCIVFNKKTRNKIPSFLTFNSSFLIESLFYLQKEISDSDGIPSLGYQSV